MTSYINPSWSLPSNYNGTDIAAVYPYIALNILILVVGLPLNSYVVWLITTGAGSGVVPEFFALNLSVYEIIICSKAVPTIVYCIFHSNETTGPFNYVINFFAALSGICRPLFQCCVCVERYVAVVYPVIFMKFKPLKYRVISSAAVWLTGLGISAYAPIPPARAMCFYILLPLYLLFFCIKGFCSIAVLKALRRPGPGEKWSAKDAEANRMKKKAFWVILIILVSVLITYGPVVIFIIIYDTLSDSQIWNSFVMYNYLLIFAGLVQPFLYLHRTGKLPLFQCFS